MLFTGTWSTTKISERVLHKLKWTLFLHELRLWYASLCGRSHDLTSARLVLFTLCFLPSLSSLLHLIHPSCLPQSIRRAPHSQRGHQHTRWWDCLMRSDRVPQIPLLKIFKLALRLNPLRTRPRSLSSDSLSHARINPMKKVQSFSHHEYSIFWLLYSVGPCHVSSLSSSNPKVFFLVWHSTHPPLTPRYTCYPSSRILELQQQ